MSREALVVGINRYPLLKDPKTKKPKHLSLPAADAEAVARVLETYGNFRVRRMPETYKNGARRVDDDPSPMKLTRVTDLQEEIALLFNPPSNVPDTALLYFAGHGLRSDHGGVEESFLATSDVNPKRGKWGLSFSWLRQLLQKSKVRQKLVWLDCCHSGELLNFDEADPGAKRLTGNMCLIAACRGFEVAYEEVAGTHGVLTEALLTALSPESHQKPWVTNYELVDYINLSLAQTRQRPIYHNFGSEIVITGIREQIDRATLIEKVCPYKGLESFEEADAKYFYGRTALVDEMLDRLRERENNFLAVVGASGSGKSSAVKAGLLHQLKLGQRLSGSHEWQIIIFRPGEHPLKSLVRAFGGTPDKFDFRDGLNLAQLVRTTGYPGVVLVADQFEEAFTLCQDFKVREWFMSCLLGAKDKPNTNLRVIITMRADFFGKCAEEEYAGLAQHIQDNMVTVRPMNSSELTEAIEQPAWKVGLEVQEELVWQMLDDLEGVSASLPLLQYTLRELWQKRQVNRLTLAEYIQLGGVRETLPKRAEKVFSSLDKEQQSAAQRIFLELMHLGEGTEDTRRQVLKQDLVKEDLPETLVDVTVDKLVEARLLVTGERLQRGEGEKTLTTVDVAHEALIKNWKRLRGWVNDNRDALRMQRLIQSEAEKWEMKGKSRGYLRSGAPLVEAQSYLKSYGELGLLSPLAKDFISQSIRRQRRDRRLQILKFISYVAISIAIAIVASKWTPVERVLEQDIENIDNWLQPKHEPVQALVSAIKATGLSYEKLKNIRPKVQSSLRNAIVQARESNIFEGHNNQIADLAFSPDGQYIVSGSDDLTLRLWSREGNPIGKPFRGHSDSVTSVAFSPDGQYIVSGSEDKTLRLWDLQGNPLGEFRGHDSGVYSVAFSPDGQYIVSGSWDKTLRLWDLRGNPIGEPFEGHEDGVYSVGFSPDGQYIVSGSYDNTLRLWDLQGNPMGEPFRGHDSWVASVAFSPDGQYIVSGSWDNTLRLWDLKGNPIGEPFQGHEDGVTSVAFSPDGQYIVSGSYDNTLRLWDNRGNPIGEPFRGHASDVLSVAFSPDGKYIVSGSDDNTLRLWYRIGEPFQGHDRALNAVAFSPDGQYIVSGSGDLTLRLWDLSGNPIGEPFRGHTRDVLSVAFSPDGKYIVSGSKDNTLRLWDLEGNPIGEPFRRDNGFVFSVAFSPDGKYIVSASSEASLRLWDFKGNHISKIGPKHVDDLNTTVFSVAFSPDGKYIVSGRSDGRLHLWDLQGNPIGERFWGHNSGVNSVAFSPDSKYIVSGSDDLTLRLWNLRGNPIGEPFRGHDRAVFSVAFSPDGQKIVSGSSDGTLRLWDLQGNQIDDLFRGHNDYVFSVAFSPDGKYIVSGARDGSLRLWDDRHWKNWLSMACNRLLFHPAIAGPEPDDIASAAANTCQKYVWNDIEKAKFAIGQGRLLARKKGDVSGAVAKFAAARKLDDTVDFQALSESAPKLVAAKKIDRGLFLAREQGDVSGAITQFAAAQELDDTVDLEALKESALLLAAARTIDRVENLIQAGRVKAALVAFQEALQLNPQLQISASLLYNLCRQGTLQGEAARAMDACDRAVALLPETPQFRYIRGLARSLRGDTSGAIEDFQVLLKLIKSHQSKARVQGWIDALRAGENPFTEELLEKMR